MNSLDCGVLENTNCLIISIHIPGAQVFLPYIDRSKDNDGGVFDDDNQRRLSYHE